MDTTEACWYTSPQVLDVTNYSNAYHVDAVTNLSYSAGFNGTINFSWNASNIHNETGFQVWRSTDGGTNWVLLTTTGRDATSAQVTGQPLVSCLYAITGISWAETAPDDRPYGDDALIWAHSLAGTFSCASGGGGGPTPATNLNVTSQSCSGSTVNVSFSWTPASGTTFTSQFHDWDTDTIDPWNRQSLSVGQSSVTRTGLPPSVTIYWRVNTQASSGTWYPSAIASFTTHNCGGGTPTPATNLAVTSQSCSGSTVNVLFSWTLASGATFDDQWHDWDLDIVDDWNGQQLSVGQSSLTRTGLPQSTTIYWRVNTHVTGGNWSTSEIASFTTVQCTAQPPAPPASMAVSFDFFGDPYKVLMCFNPSSGATGYDVLFLHWNGGAMYNEIITNVSTTNCAGALGTGQRVNNIFIDYIHFSVRACNAAGCSGWTDMTTPPNQFWMYLPCYVASGSGCGGGGTPLANGHSH